MRVGPMSLRNNMKISKFSAINAGCKEARSSSPRWYSELHLAVRKERVILIEDRALMREVQDNVL
jgi:hypothetical protein